MRPGKYRYQPDYKDDKGKRFSVEIGQRFQCDECPAAIVDETVAIVYETWAAAEQLRQTAGQPIPSGPAWWSDVVRLYGLLRKKHESELVRLANA